MLRCLIMVGLKKVQIAELGELRFVRYLMYGCAYIGKPVFSRTPISNLQEKRKMQVFRREGNN